MSARKQTAGNSKLLAHLKALYNTPIFTRASKTLNESGPDACIAYVLTLVCPEHRAAVQVELTQLV